MIKKGKAPKLLSFRCKKKGVDLLTGVKKELLLQRFCRMERMSTLTLETRNDLHLTSTGVAHSIRKQPPENSIKVPIYNILKI